MDKSAMVKEFEELKEKHADLRNAYNRKREEYKEISELFNKTQMENEGLKQQISELKDRCGDRDEIIRCLREENVELKKQENGKINLNDRIKVKLTPFGAEIYYHQYDELNKKIKENGGTELETRMPKIDKDGYTEFQLYHFMNLYGEHIGMCKPNVIEPLDIVIAE